MNAIVYPCQTSDVLFTEGPHWCRTTVYQEEDWVEAVPQLVDPVSCDPVNITGWQFDLFVRPTFGYPAPSILYLTSAAPSGDRIVIENASQGLIAMHVAWGTMVDLPAGAWEHYLTFTFTDTTLGLVTKTLWRGPFVIYPGHRG